MNTFLKYKSCSQKGSRFYNTIASIYQLISVADSHILYSLHSVFADHFSTHVEDLRFLYTFLTWINIIDLPVLISCTHYYPSASVDEITTLPFSIFSRRAMACSLMHKIYVTLVQFGHKPSAMFGQKFRHKTNFGRIRKTHDAWFQQLKWWKKVFKHP